MPDTQATYRSLKPQTALLRAASGMSRTIDPRRPRNLNAFQEEVDRYPKVTDLRLSLSLLRKTLRDQGRTIASTKGTPLYNKYQRAYRCHRNSRRRHEKALLLEIKEKYKKEQPMLDIQQ